ncbi:MAG: DNA-formamidopyrimidine glycosylase [Candidatus Colwellbacteria bacterium]|nr:DNA-formamidopyrimidine glycosylase [Candidatus Colwellbacteria bacterium]
MPELPEVESTVRGLSPLIVGRKIVSVWSDAPKLIRSGTFADFKDNIRGRKVVSISRRAKNILIGLDGGYTLLIHLKMTGHLMVGRWSFLKDKGREIAKTDSSGAMSDKVNNYVHVIFVLDDGNMLALSDLRKFAKVSLGKTEELFYKEKLDQIGPEATDIPLLDFEKALKSSKRSIKQVLLDQEKIAGIGNIYSDDILWKARIHPLRPSISLTSTEIKAIYKAMREILNIAIKLRGTSISDYRDVRGEKGGYGPKRLVYRRDGEPCKRCGTPITKLKVGGRTARFCPSCQII